VTRRIIYCGCVAFVTVQNIILRRIEMEQDKQAIEAIAKLRGLFRERICNHDITFDPDQLDAIMEVYDSLFGYSHILQTLASLGYVKMVEQKLPEEDLVEDGFGSSASAVCPICGERAVYVVRPGDIRCMSCENKEFENREGTGKVKE
jgi:hypothetical protein